MRIEVKAGVPPTIIPQDNDAPMLLPDLEGVLGILRSSDGQALAVVANWQLPDGQALQVHLPMTPDTAVVLMTNLFRFLDEHPDMRAAAERALSKQ